MIGTDSEAPPDANGRFSIRLDNFEGPFDLLLSLIGKRQLDVTEVALSQVTDDFIAYIKAAGHDWDLGEATEFLVIAATLLDLKAARLLPSAEVEDDEDIALLEARDLLFARLLQYRAYKQVAGYLAELERVQGLRFDRDVALEPRFADMIPDVLIGVDLAGFARVAAVALTPKPVPVIDVAHVHAPQVSVSEHMAIMRARLRRYGSATFRSLVEDCTVTLEVVARFLGLLELYREGVVGFDQAGALSDLHVRWIGGASEDEPEDVADSDAVDEPDDDASARRTEIDEEYR